MGWGGFAALFARFSWVNCLSCPVSEVRSHQALAASAAGGASGKHFARLRTHAPVLARAGGAMGAVDRLVLWNIDLTLLDVGRVARDAYADAFRRVTGRSLAALPQLAGRSDTEIFYESLYLNDVPTGLDDSADAELVIRYCEELEAAF